MGKVVCFLGLAELGWEYLRWQGYCRHMVKNAVDFDFVVACTHAGREVFYKDFCSDVFTHNWWFYLEGGKHGHPHAFGLSSFKDVDFLRLVGWIKNVVKNRYGYSLCEVVHPPSGVKYSYNHVDQYMRKLPIDPIGMDTWNLYKKEFVIIPERTMMIFPRNRLDAGENRNWGEENYKKLIDELIKRDFCVVISGLPESTACYIYSDRPGFINLCKLPKEYILATTLAALEDCLVAVGGQSALPVIALGQGVPVVMWGHEPERHEFFYNWSKTSVRFIESPKYDISPEAVIEAILDFYPRVSKWNPPDIPSWKVVPDGFTFPLSIKVKK